MCVLEGCGAVLQAIALYCSSCALLQQLCLFAVVLTKHTHTHQLATIITILLRSPSICSTPALLLLLSCSLPLFCAMLWRPCVCVCVCVCACVCACACVCVCTTSQRRLCAYVCVYAQVHMCANTFDANTDQDLQARAHLLHTQIASSTAI